MVKSPFSKLLKLKKWLTLPEVAKQLSEIRGEEVTEADILRFALDGYLKLSVNLVNNTPVLVGHMIQVDLENYASAIKDGSIPKQLHSGMMLHFTENNKVNFLEFFKNSYMPLNGIWDISMTFGESIFLEQEYQKLSGGPILKLEPFNGIMLDGTDGTIFQIQDRLESLASTDHISYFPATSLPEDSVIVVRTEAFKEFEQLISENETERNQIDLSETERRTLLKLVLGMAIDAYGYDINSPRNSLTGEKNGLSAKLQTHGIYINDDTIRKYLTEAKNIVSSQT